jgi:hypothetical protein
MNIIFSSAIYVAPAAAVRKRPVQSGSHESEQQATTPLPIGALLDSPKKIFFSKIPILIRALILQGFLSLSLCEGLIRWGGGFF